MREILFRGKRIDNGEWIAGQLIRYNIDPESVGQYTRLTDKNGKKIFEGDIVRADNGHISKVVFWHGRFCLYCECHKQYSDSIPNDIVEVIGNIHDNPELLED